MSNAERAFTLFDNFLYTDAENLVGLACKQAAVSSNTVSSGLKDTISAMSNAELRELEEISTVRNAFATAFSRDAAPTPPVCMYVHTYTHTHTHTHLHTHLHTHTLTHTHTQASIAKRAGAEAPVRNAAPAEPSSLSKGKSKYVRQLENSLGKVDVLGNWKNVNVLVQGEVRARELGSSQMSSNFCDLKVTNILTYRTCTYRTSEQVSARKLGNPKP